MQVDFGNSKLHCNSVPLSPLSGQTENFSSVVSGGRFVSNLFANVVGVLQEQRQSLR